MRVRLSIIILMLVLVPVHSWAARGFGTTSGTAATDNIVTGTIASTTARSLCMRVNTNTIVSSARLLVHEGAGFPMDIAFLTVADRYRLTVGWSTTNGIWTTPATTGAHSFCFTYNGTGTAVDPVMYVDGASVAVTRATAPAGTLNSATEAYTFGNSILSDRIYNGILSEIAVWNVVITGADVLAIHNGQRPDGIGTAPTHYWKLCGGDSPELAEVGGSSGTVTGALRQTHPVRNCGSQASATGAGN